MWQPHLHLPAEPHPRCPRPLNYPLLRECHSDLITSNYCPYCCLERRSNRSAAERSPKQVNLGRLDTVSSLRPHAAHFRSQEGPNSQYTLPVMLGSGRLQARKGTSSGSAEHKRAVTSGKVTSNALYWPPTALAVSTLVSGCSFRIRVPWNLWKQGLYRHHQLR